MTSRNIKAVYIGFLLARLGGNGKLIKSIRLEVSSVRAFVHYRPSSGDPRHRHPIHVVGSSAYTSNHMTSNHREDL
jgi:hypothetical protein